MGLSRTGTVSEGIEGAHGLPVSRIDDGPEPEPGDKLQKTRIDNQRDSGKKRKSESAGWQTLYAKRGNIKKIISPSAAGRTICSPRFGICEHMAASHSGASKAIMRPGHRAAN